MSDSFDDLGFKPTASHDFSDLGFKASDSSGPEQLGRQPSKFGAEYDLASLAPPGDIVNDLLTNKPIGGIASPFTRSIPATVGGALGALVAAPTGVGAVPAALIGSALGGAGGEGIRQGAASLYSLYRGGPPVPPEEVLKSMAIQGGVQGMAEGAGQVLKAAAPFAKKLIAGEMRIGPNIKTDIAEAVLNDPDILRRSADVNSAYANFENITGTQSPKLAREIAGKMESPAQSVAAIEEAKSALAPYIKYDESRRAGSIVYDVPKIKTDIESGKIQSGYLTQLLYEGSQAGNYLKRLAKAGSPQEAVNQASIGEFVNNANNLIEELNPGSGYGLARTAARENAIREAFDSPFPLNQNGQPNVLRSMAAMGSGFTTGAALGGMVGGIPGAALGGAAGAFVGPLAISPYAAGLAVRGASALSPVAKAVAGGIRFAPGSIAAYYNSPGVAP